MLIAGIDEAGRGPVIGPMVMAICVMDDSDIPILEEIGVKDSKLLTPKKRKEIYDKLINLIDYEYVVLTNDDIDNALNSENLNLNLLEGLQSAIITNKLMSKIKRKNMKMDKIILDCPSTSVAKYEDYFKMNLIDKDITVVAEHKADSKYLIVGAASVIAKEIREMEIAKIKKKYSIEFGSGYPSDPRTKAFIEKNYDKYSIFRKTWKTYTNILAKKKQQKLF
jgi:ribonuclease HII